MSVKKSPLKFLRKSAFLKGAANGLSAPVNMFDVADFPPMPKLVEVKVPVRSTQAALAGDWRAVGDDIRSSMKDFSNKYAEEAL